MQITITYERNKPTTSCGESLIVTTLYSSFNQAEIDDLEKTFDKAYKTGLIVEVNADADSD